MADIRLVNENGELVAKDPDTGTTIPIDLADVEVNDLLGTDNVGPEQLDETGDYTTSSLSTDRLFTEARMGTFVVHTDSAGTYWLDGPNGSIVDGGDYDTLATELPNAVSDLDCVVFAEGDYFPTQTLNIDKAVSLISKGAYFEPADDTFNYVFQSNVPQPSGGMYARKAVEVSGFEADLRAAQGQSHGFYSAQGYLSNQQISNNTVRNFSGQDVFWQGSNSHVWSFFGNDIQDAWGSNTSSGALRLYSGWNFIFGNDLGGGIVSDAMGSNFIFGNSIFNSKKAGASLSANDVFDGNVVTDNYSHGLTLTNGESNVIISNNAITNNSKQTKDSSPTFSGIQFGGSSTISGVVVSGNRILNKYPLEGDHTGEQNYGINIDATLEDCVIDGSNVMTDNASGAFNFNSSTLNNCRVENPMGANRTSGSSRPTKPYTGMVFFDTNLGQPIFYDGSGWVDATGTSV